MMMGILLLLMIAVSVVFGCLTGQAEAVGAAAVEGAEAAVSFCVSVGGMICLWCAVMELMSRCGVTGALARLLLPVLRRLFPQSAKKPEILEPLSANVSANLLGLGNAATPMGMRAARGMAAMGKDGEAPDELCRLVVLNTASIQLLPTTVAAIRGSYGAAVPFDILPAVWLSSAFSVLVGLLAAKLMAARH